MTGVGYCALWTGGRIEGLDSDEGQLRPIGTLAQTSPLLAFVRQDAHAETLQSCRFWIIQILCLHLFEYSASTCEQRTPSAQD